MQDLHRISNNAKTNISQTFIPKVLLLWKLYCNFIHLGFNLSCKSVSLVPCVFIHNGKGLLLVITMYILVNVVMDVEFNCLVYAIIGQAGIFFGRLLTLVMIIF